MKTLAFALTAGALVFLTTYSFTHTGVSGGVSGGASSNARFQLDELEHSPIPEPGSIGLLTIGAGLLAARRCRGS